MEDHLHDLDDKHCLYFLINKCLTLQVLLSLDKEPLLVTTYLFLQLVGLISLVA